MNTYRANQAYYGRHHAGKPRLGRGIAAVAVTVALVAGISFVLTRSDSADGANPLAGSKLYAVEDSNAARQAVEWRDSRPQAAEAMERLAQLPAAKWLTSMESLGSEAEQYLDGAGKAGGLPVVVAYNIPHRDCGMYSAGGAQDLEGYKAYIDKLASLIGTRKAVVVVEPDAIANLADRADGECLDAGQRKAQFEALSYASGKLADLRNTAVYLDAGHSDWVDDAGKLADTLRQAGAGKADGFSLNVSNFQPLADSVAYGNRLSDRLDGKHFVVDTSRNGKGAYENPEYPDFSWCNPPGRALGHYPTADTGEERADAYLYIKAPGESDGQDDNQAKCAGGPRAGEWWPEYALGLVQRWPQNLQPTSAK